MLRTCPLGCHRFQGRSFSLFICAKQGAATGSTLSLSTKSNILPNKVRVSALLKLNKSKLSFFALFLQRHLEESARGWLRCEAFVLHAKKMPSYGEANIPHCNVFSIKALSSKTTIRLALLLWGLQCYFFKPTEYLPICPPKRCDLYWAMLKSAWHLQHILSSLLFISRL